MVEHATLAAARAAVVGNERLLVVVCCEDSREPDRRMLANWHDAAVRRRLDACSEWFVSDHFAESGEARRTLRLTWPPAAVARRGDREVGRLEGCCDAAAVLQWLDDVAAGRWCPLDAGERRRRDVDGTLRLSPMQRYDLAKQLAKAGRFDDAAEAYVQLWATMAIEEPATVGVRGSFMVGEMQALARHHEPARRRFGALRDACEAGLPGLVEDTRAALRARHDWVLLNRVLDDGARTLSWFDVARSDPAQAPAFACNDAELEDLLLANDRWADLGTLIGDPRQRLARDRTFELECRRVTAKHRTDPRSEREFARIEIVRRREQFAILYAAMLGARRADDAAWVRAEALRAEDSATMRRALGRHAARVRRSLRGA